jgi:hypothetical protein
VVIALLAVPGVDPIVLDVFLDVVLGRSRWASRQPGSITGVACVVDAEAHPMGHRARRGDGRWFRNVPVWTPGPLCLRNAPAVDRVDGQPAATDHDRRLGNKPQAVTVVGDGVRVRITLRAQEVPSSPRFTHARTREVNPA